MAIACPSVEFKRKPLIASLHVVLNVPPYVAVSSVAVSSTGSDAGASATSIIELDSKLIDDVDEVFAVFGAVATGVGAGAAMGLRSVVASTTIYRWGIGLGTV
jgi:hypothetical protein